jgi:succinate dehydrogenase / fumarate reductase cytochrome b subunit
MSAVLETLTRFYASSIGKKILVALTGLGLVVFLFGHMLGNLLIYVGPDAINAYALKLKSMGPLLWAARLGLLAMVALHVVATIQLTRQNREARPGGYGHEKTQVASKASRIMIWSGLTILAFVIYHILHFTVHAGNDYGSYMTMLDGKEVHDVYKMVIDGFSWAPASIFYLISMALLCNHLSHGVSSLFQTLGLATNQTWPLFQALGYGYAALIMVGNCSIPISIWLFGYGQ